MQPLYYDPVHDFGIMRFDPAALHFMQARPSLIHPLRCITWFPPIKAHSVRCT